MSSKKSEAREHKEQLYKLFARIGNALANPHRLELIDLLVQSPRTVEELASLAQMSIANTSQHLQRLKKARLVIDQRNGLYVKYGLADPEIARLWIELRRVAEMQFSEVETELDLYRIHRSDLIKISIAEVSEGLRRNEIILIDARPEVEFQAGHLPGAVSYPIDTLCYRIDEIPLGKMLVTYCRGPYCSEADEALILLSAYGYPVKRLEEGVVEWHEAGNRLET
ncbi:MAG: metalloregulator ArsR/SmtB family transcription factor [Anaerolineales bacterium]|nr:metalloregulator ArsR/SmtB family transcription factor [Anaerolineales bacterium]